MQPLKLLMRLMPLPNYSFLIHLILKPGSNQKAVKMVLKILIMWDKTGAFWSIVYDKNTPHITALQATLRKMAAENNFNIDFKGQYFENKEQIKVLWYILLIVLVLLYFILAIQYENLVLPVI